MKDILDQAIELSKYTKALRRDFHRHPELGFKEVRTAGIVARELGELGLDVSTEIAETGVVALIEGKKPGPVVLLRFDMDALPIQEETGAEYASENPGVMHACGHDGHVAVGLTVARMLHSRQDSWAGTVKLVFQPAEEGVGGAERMVAEGVLDNPHPNYCLALHLWNNQPLGWLGITGGPVMAAADTFLVRIMGKGGHGAMPHLAIDPVLASAQVICALQSIASRNVDPMQTAVVSVTMVHGGDAFNVIPEQVELQGTIRTFEPQVREMVWKRFRDIVGGVAESLGCQAEIKITTIGPAVINDSKLTQMLHQIATRMFPDTPADGDFRTMGSDDMAFMMQDIPGCYFFIGSADETRGLNAPHHHPRFDIDEDALPRGVALMTAAVLELLK